MSGLRQPHHAAVAFAFGLGLAMLACLGRAQANETDVAFNFDPRLSGYPAFTFASLTPFEIPPPPAPHLAEPFGAKLSGVLKDGLQRKWAGVAHKLPHERKILARCRAGAMSCTPAAKHFLAIVDKGLAREGLTRIAEINRAINLDIKPVDDMTQYHVIDLWATPLMTFTSNAGDCEDYAIAKYLALLELGIAEDDLRLLVVHLRTKDENHAVAAVRYQGRWLILDNRTLEIRDDTKIAEFDPLFVLDREGVRRMTMPGAQPQEKRIASTAAVAPQDSSGPQGLMPLL
jgi:predicted transglutaminase-like cysteine proteinase